jgi:hypothetical protein
MIEVELPGGGIAEFPDGTSHDIIKRAISKHKPTVSQDIAKTVPAAGARMLTSVAGTAGDMDSAARAGAGWLLKKFGLGEAAGALETAPSVVPNTEQLRSKVEGVTGPLYQPQTIPGKIVGKGIEYAPAGFGAGGMVAKAGATVLPAITGTLAGEAAKGTPMEPFAEPIATLLTPFGANKAENVRRVWDARKALPQKDQIKAARDHLYDLSEQAGVRIKPEAYKRFSDDVKDTLLKDRFTMIDTAPPAVAKKVRMLVDYESAADPLALKDLHHLRQSVGKLIDTTDGVQRGIGLQLYGKLTKFMNGLTEADMVGPTSVSKYGVELQKSADELHRRYKNTKKLDMFYKQAKNRSANYTQAGEATGLQQKFRGLADKFADEDSPEYRFFTAEERAAIEKVAQGTVPMKIVRTLSKLAPWGSQKMAGYGGMGMLGASLGGPAGAAIATAVPASLGTIGKVLFNVLTKLQANKASDLVRGVSPKVLKERYPAGLPGVLASDTYNDQ